MTKLFATVTTCTALFFAPIECAIGNDGLGLVGHGNSTCEHWLASNDAYKSEVIAWMLGFASAENLDRFLEGKPPYRLRLLTKEYLRGEIQETCADRAKSNSTMAYIIMKTLGDFPVEQ